MLGLFILFHFEQTNNAVFFYTPVYNFLLSIIKTNEYKNDVRIKKYSFFLNLKQVSGKKKTKCGKEK